MHKILLFLLCLVSFWGASAQLSTPGTLPSRRFNLSGNIPEATMPSFDKEAILAEDALEQQDKDIPPRFGFEHNVSISTQSHGQWETLVNGDRVWRLQISSADAYSINFVFEYFDLPVGAEMYISSATDKFEIGAFTHTNTLPDRQFATAPVKGSSVVIEYFVPARVSSHESFIISKVVHAYKNLFEEVFEKNYRSSGTCNIDVACTQSAGWTDPINSVAMILVGGSRSCTGAMVNNTRYDATPYFLTANHCMGGLTGGANLSTWVFMFNYQSATCNGADGPTNMSIAGGTVRAVSAPSDFSLIELSAQPQPSWTVYYAGWQKDSIGVTQATAIHHPSGDVKKISRDTDPVGVFPWTGTVNDHWHPEWDMLNNAGAIAITEPGSSGSPLFDQNQRVIGQLHGGPSSCSSTDKHDLFGRFDVSWNGGGTAATRLKDWLDPINANPSSINGQYFIPVAQPWNVRSQGIENLPAGATCDSLFSPAVTVQNRGSNTVTKITIEYSLDNAAPQVFIWNGSIAQFASASIPLPQITVGLGAHTYNVTLSQPNDSLDLDLTDNTSTFTFTRSSGTMVNVQIRTDNNPQQTSFTLSTRTGNTTGATLYGITFTAATGAGTINNNTYCLQPGCYRFIIRDSGRNGICCASGNGYFQVSDEFGNVFGRDSVFTRRDTIDFCIPLVGINEANQQTEQLFKFYPNPNNGQQLWVETYSEEPSHIDVLDMLGRKVRTFNNLSGNVQSLDISNIENGLYFLQIHFSGGSSSSAQKLLITK